MTKLIILDRDGVINYDSDDYVKSPDEWRAIPGSLQAIADLNRAGYRVVIATNQSGVARGLYNNESLSAIHSKMAQALKLLGGEIDRVFYCPHGPWDRCTCRKPRPGLFEQIQTHYQLPLINVPAVGDSIRDLQASIQLGCRPILVKTGNGATVVDKESKTLKILKPLIFDDLQAVAKYILGKTHVR